MKESDLPAAVAPRQISASEAMRASHTPEVEKLRRAVRHRLRHWAASAVGGLGSLILARISSACALARAAGKKPSTIRCASPCTSPHAAIAA